VLRVLCRAEQEAECGMTDTESEASLVVIVVLAAALRKEDSPKEGNQQRDDLCCHTTHNGEAADEGDTDLKATTKI